jgi:hypothetical protein
MKFTLTLWSTLLERLVVWNPKVHYRVHKSPPPQTTSSYFPKINFNIILHYMATSSEWTLPSRLFNQNFAKVKKKKSKAVPLHAMEAHGGEEV